MLLTVRLSDKPWMTKYVTKLLRIRDRVFKKFKRTRTHIHKQNWKNSRTEAKLAINLAKNNYYDGLYRKLEDPHTAPKQYWRIAKEIYGMKKNRSIPALNDNAQTISTSADKASIFNKYFVSQSDLHISVITLSPPMVVEINSSLETILVGENDVRKLLLKLDVSKATGPDNIGNTILKQCAESLSVSLATLFNKSFQMGRVPTQWKIANVTPVYKKGDKSLVNNYRPVSLLTLCG